MDRASIASTRRRGYSVGAASRSSSCPTTSGASSLRWCARSGNVSTATATRRSCACARRSRVPRACSRTSGSSRTRRPRSWTRSARSSSATAASWPFSPRARMADHRGGEASAVAWLDSLSPWPQEGFGLERMLALLAELGDPQNAYPAVHVVGTNGKSTATITIEQLLLEEGLSVGATISPHVVSWSERIRVNGEEAEFEEAVGRVRPAAERLDATQFETVTAAALSAFAVAEVDVAVVEAGLGGRLDATNVLRTRVVLLTNVALEHTDVLGDTLEEIAREKLAVAREGCTVVLPDRTYAHLVPGREIVVGGAREAAEAFLGHAIDADPMLRKLAKVGSRLVATRSSSARALPAEEVADRARRHFDHVEAVEGPVRAVARAHELGEPVLVTGSLYLLGDLAQGE